VGELGLGIGDETDELQQVCFPRSEGRVEIEEASGLSGMCLDDVTEFGEDTLCTLRLVEFCDVGLCPFTGIDLLDFLELSGWVAVE